MNEISAVRQQILTVFQSVPMPAADKILLSRIPNDDLEYQPIRQAFEGKSADALSLDFFKTKSYWWHYLSAEAYRYYLPARLIAALDNFAQDHSFVHSVLYNLRLDAYAIYYDGADEEFIEQTSLFTSEQFCAVNAFLSLFLYNDDQDSTSLTFLAAAAMREGWGRYVCPEQIRFAEFNSRMRHYTYPPVTDPTLAALVDEIRVAFADTPYPGDDQLSGSRQGDEAAECALALRGVKWQMAHPRLIASNYTALSFLTHTGHRYFLPAFLLADLLDRGDSNAEPIFHLIHGFCEEHQDTIDDLVSIQLSEEEKELLRQHQDQMQKTDWYTYGVERMSGFTRAERIAIIHFMEYRAEDDEFHAADISMAIERYWKPSLETSL